MQLKKVRLTLTTTKFVCSEADFDREQPGKTLVLPADTYRKAIALGRVDTR